MHRDAQKIPAILARSAGESPPLASFIGLTCGALWNEVLEKKGARGTCRKQAASRLQGLGCRERSLRGPSPNDPREGARTSGPVAPSVSPAGRSSQYSNYPSASPYAQRPH
jgi:hypothetical protein